MRDLEEERRQRKLREELAKPPPGPVARAYMEMRARGGGPKVIVERRDGRPISPPASSSPAAPVATPRPRPDRYIMTWGVPSTGVGVNRHQRAGTSEVPAP